MTDWIDFNQWQDCASLVRPGYVFEIVNAEDQSILTACTPVVDIPWDWSSEPLKFRLVPELPPQHSGPMPKAADQP